MFFKYGLLIKLYYYMFELSTQNYSNIGDKEEDICVKYNSIIHTLAKDEDHIINEWIVHHILLGFEHIYIYDDRSNYPISERIKELPEWIEKKVTVYLIDFDFYDIKLNGIIPKSINKSIFNKINIFDNKQMFFLYYFMYLHKNVSKWCLFFDVDEFVYLKNNNNINDLLNNYDKYDCIYIPWLMYGTSFQIDHNPDYLIMDQNIYHDKLYFGCGKSIAKLEKIELISNGHIITEKNCLHLNNKEEIYNLPIHINHYNKISVKTFLRRKLRFEIGHSNGDIRKPANIMNMLLSSNDNLHKDEMNYMTKYIIEVNKIIKKPKQKKYVCPYSLYIDGMHIYSSNPTITYDSLNKILECDNITYSNWEDLLPNDFDCNKYKYYNFDLNLLNNNELKKHYIEAGKKEGRIYKLKDLPEDFNVEKYKYYNPDLSGMPNSECEKHYANHGKKEGRIYKIKDLPEDFKVEKYKYYNPDLSGMSNGECEKHYVNHGKKENRIYKEAPKKNILLVGTCRIQRPFGCDNPNKVPINYPEYNVLNYWNTLGFLGTVYSITEIKQYFEMILNNNYFDEITYDVINHIYTFCGLSYSHYKKKFDSISNSFFKADIIIIEISSLYNISTIINNKEWILHDYTENVLDNISKKEITEEEFIKDLNFILNILKKYNKKYLFTTHFNHCNIKNREIIINILKNNIPENLIFDPTKLVLDNISYSLEDDCHYSKKFELIIMDEIHKKLINL